MGDRFMKAFIHMLDDDSLLYMFSVCRSVLLYRNEVVNIDNMHIPLIEDWSHECWWYKLTHVCRRWRDLILGSASHLGLCLYCTYGTPIANMLERSPPLPLIIDLMGKSREITTKDKVGIMLALQHHDRVCRICLGIDVTDLQKFIVAMDKEFPILEGLLINPLTYNDIGLKLPKTFEAPHLHHLALFSLALPMGSTLLATAVDLVLLSLNYIPSPSYFLPNDFLQQVSLLPQLEMLGIGFYSPVPNYLVERQLSDMHIMTHVTLSNLRWLVLHGASAYSVALLPWITAPLLETFEVSFFYQTTISIPKLRQFIISGENLRFTSANLQLSEIDVKLHVYP